MLSGDKVIVMVIGCMVVLLIALAITSTITNLAVEENLKDPIARCVYKATLNENGTETKVAMLKECANLQQIINSKKD
jgi:hypothetical protein